MRKMIILAAVGIVAGFVNGFLGTGGGILLIFALSRVFKESEGKDVYATTLGITLCLSLVSVIVYMKSGSVELTEGLKYGVAAIPGGLIGAYLLDRLDGKIVKKMFAALLIFAGLNMSGVF